MKDLNAVTEMLYGDGEPMSGVGHDGRAGAGAYGKPSFEHWVLFGSELDLAGSRRHRRATHGTGKDRTPAGDALCPLRCL